MATVASLIGANSTFALDAVDQGDTSADEDSSDSEAPGTVIAGWKIQIAATPTQASAEDILDRALAKASGVLGNASPYTEPVRFRRLHALPRALRRLRRQGPKPAPPAPTSPSATSLAWRSATELNWNSQGVFFVRSRT